MHEMRLEQQTSFIPPDLAFPPFANATFCRSSFGGHHSSFQYYSGGGHGSFSSFGGRGFGYNGFFFAGSVRGQHPICQICGLFGHIAVKLY